MGERRAAAAQGELLPRRDQDGRRLRTAAHLGTGRVVLSGEQDGVWVATVRLAADDAPDVMRQLTQSLLSAAAQDAEVG